MFRSEEQSGRAQGKYNPSRTTPQESSKVPGSAARQRQKPFFASSLQRNKHSKYDLCNSSVFSLLPKVGNLLGSTHPSLSCWPAPRTRDPSVLWEHDRDIKAKHKSNKQQPQHRAHQQNKRNPLSPGFPPKGSNISAAARAVSRHPQLCKFSRKIRNVFLPWAKLQTGQERSVQAD